ncbi:TetR/AcrR family transcriptional regulator [Pseudoalteromonas sp. SS15]|uniref:TetR/AcrR family transcriptional regulator n=1 Tax=Pseudoalteromonas sp. SS15 TaxID=3139393 RepID=UPI003BAB1C32
MPWDVTHKTKSKEKILISAAKLFVEKGFDAVGINDVMKSANMTRGAFYAHFKSKADLYNQALVVAAFEARESITQGCDQGFASLQHNYLQQGQDPTLKDNQQCPIALLISDIRQREPLVRETYEKVFKGFVKYIESQGLTEAEALKEAATMIGAVALSESLTDKKLVEKLLAACEG